MTAPHPRRRILYMAHPVRPTPEQLECYSGHSEPMRDAIDCNVRSALRWLAWLRKTLPTVTVIAPWIEAILSGANDADEAQRERGLVDCCTVVAMCDAMVCVGGRISSGMQREIGSANRVFDLTELDSAAPTEFVGGNPSLRELVAWEIRREFDVNATP